MIDANKKARTEDGIPVATAGTAPPPADNLAPAALEGFVQDDVSRPVSNLMPCYSRHTPSAIIVAGDGTDRTDAMRRLSSGRIFGAAAVWVGTKADQDRVYEMMMESNKAAKKYDSGPQKVYFRVTDENNWPTHPYGVTLNIGAGAASSPSKGLKRKKAPVSVIDPDRNRHERVDNLAPRALEGFVQDDVSRPISNLMPCYSRRTPSAIIVAGDGTDRTDAMRRLTSGRIFGAAAVWVGTKAYQDRVYEIMMESNKAAKKYDSGPQKDYCRVTDEKNWPTHPYGVTLNMGLQRKKSPGSAIVK